MSCWAGRWKGSRKNPFQWLAELMNHSWTIMDAELFPVSQCILSVTHLLLGFGEWVATLGAWEFCETDPHSFSGCLYLRFLCKLRLGSAIRNVFPHWQIRASEPSLEEIWQVRFPQSLELAKALQVASKSLLIFLGDPPDNHILRFWWFNILLHQGPAVVRSGKAKASGTLPAVSSVLKAGVPSEKCVRHRPSPSHGSEVEGKQLISSAWSCNDVQNAPRTTREIVGFSLDHHCFLIGFYTCWAPSHSIRSFCRWCQSSLDSSSHGSQHPPGSSSVTCFPSKHWLFLQD